MAAQNQIGKPFKGVRKIIADRMMSSLSATAQLTYHGDADISALMNTREVWKTRDCKISLEACVIYSLVKTIAEFGDFNGSSDQGMIMTSPKIDLAIAVATPNGLMTPVLRDIGRLNLQEISKFRQEVVGRAISGNLCVSELKGGTFTLSNLGHTRVKYFTPILNGGQIALLGVGSLMNSLRMSADGELATQKLLPLSLTADHRVVDGDPAGRFLSKLCYELENIDDSQSLE